MFMESIRAPMDLDGPGCYVWRHDVADRVLWRLTGNTGLHVLKVGHAKNVGDRAEEGAKGNDTQRSRGRYEPYIYAGLPGWKPWRCVKWSEEETLLAQEGRLSGNLTRLNDEQRAAIYAEIAPDLAPIPAGTEIYVGNLANLANLFPYCALTGEWKRAVHGPIQEWRKPYI